MFTVESVNDALAGAVRRAAEPIAPGELVSQQIDRAARRVGYPRSVIQRLWYRQMTKVPAHVALTLLAFDRRTARLDDELDELLARMRALREGR